MKIGQYLAKIWTSV